MGLPGFTGCAGWKGDNDVGFENYEWTHCGRDR